MNSRKLGLVVVAALIGVSAPVGAGASAHRSEAGVASEKAVAAKLERLPLYFVANHGQADDRVDFLVQGRETNVYFTPQGITYQLGDRASKKRWAVKLDFVGANKVTPQGRGLTAASINYFKGPRKEWETGIPTYSGLVYRNLWDGIDLVYSGTASSLKQAFVVHPGADPDDIRLVYRGATSVRRTDGGAIEVSTPAGGFTDSPPLSFQRIAGQRATVQSSYVLGTSRYRERAYGFEVGAYDRTRTLVIDPEIVIYAGFIGGAESDEAYGIAVDGAGAAYVTGFTSSSETTFPAAGGPDLSYNGSFSDAFVAKVAPGGGSLEYAGFIGGDGTEEGRGIAVDGAGAVYVTGYTRSSEATFPVNGGPDLTYGGDADAFVAKVAPGGGSLEYAGYLGGSSFDQGRAIAVDGAGAAYVSGSTQSSEVTFPMAGGPDVSHNGNSDAFVAKVAPGGGSLAYAGYIGGSEEEHGEGIAVDGAGAAYVTGDTGSNEASFPVRGGPDLVYNGQTDAFVAKVTPGGGSLEYAGYIGGSGGDLGMAVAVDFAGAAYVAGGTFGSTEATFPVAGGPDLSYNGGDVDAFVAKVAPAGGSLDYAGYIGGNSAEQGLGIAVDGAGAAYVTGFTMSTEATFPVAGGPDLTYNGSTGDVYVAKVAPGGGSLEYATYIGGDDFDQGWDIAVDNARAAYVTGNTSSTEPSFPVTGGPDLSYNGGGVDAFVAKVGDPTAAGSGGSTVRRTLTVEKTGAGEGRVASSPGGIDCGADCSEEYEDATRVTLTATPAGDSSFGSWGGGCERITANQCVVPMNVSQTITVTFVPARTLTVAREGTGSGEVTSTPEGIDCGSVCAADYAHGTEVVLTATPGEDSTFGSWTGCDEVSDDECTISLTSDANVTARFDRAPVVHERRVTLFLGRHLTAHGRVWVGEGPRACAAGVPVRIQRQTPRGWVAIERRITSPDGKFRAQLPDRAGSYRVRAPSTKIGGGPDGCKNAISPVREHGHD